MENTKSVERTNSKGKQLFLAGSLEKQRKLSPFSLDLCIAFTASDISLYKLENPQLRYFFYPSTCAPAIRSLTIQHYERRTCLFGTIQP